MKQPKYKGGQCIQLKPYQELRDNLLSSVYSDEMLRKLGNALFTIYGTLSEERNEVWYQLGEYGHNVLQVPESYIKCEYRADVEQAPTAPENKERKMAFEEFDSMVRTVVDNGQFTYRELDLLLRDCLSNLKTLWAQPIYISTKKESDGISVSRFNEMVNRIEKFPSKGRFLSKILGGCTVHYCNSYILKNFECWKKRVRINSRCSNDLFDIALVATIACVALENKHSVFESALYKAVKDVGNRIEEKFSLKRDHYLKTIVKRLYEDGEYSEHSAIVYIGSELNFIKELLDKEYRSDEEQHNLIDHFMELAIRAIITIIWAEDERYGKE